MMPKPLEQIFASFTSVMELLRNRQFQDLLENYERAKQVFLVGYNVEDTVESNILFEAEGKYGLHADDYLQAFSEFVKKNQTGVDAISILLSKPQRWNTSTLNELKKTLKEHDFEELQLQKAHKLVHHKDLVDIISMVKHAVIETEPLLSVDERVDRAITKISAGKKFTPEQLQWLDYIREHLKQNMTIGADDLNDLPVFADRGGYTRFKKVFPESYTVILDDINTAVAA